jgi:hypothetical protein
VKAGQELEVLVRRLKEQEGFPVADWNVDRSVVGNPDDTRQVDVWCEDELRDGSRIWIAIDCKDRSSAIDRAEVDATITLFRDVGCHIGVIVAAHGLQAGAWKAVEKARPDVDVQVLEMSLEEALEIRWRGVFYEGVRELDQLKRKEEPSKQDVIEVGATITHLEPYARYFFHDLTSPKWLRILLDEGTAQKIASGQTPVNPVTVADYAARVAGEAPGLALELYSNLQPSDWASRWQLIEAFKEATPDDQAEFCRLSVASATVLDTALVDMAPIVVGAMSSSRPELALEFVDACLDLSVGEGPDQFRRCPENDQLRWGLARFFEGCLSSLLEHQWQGSVNLFERKLNEYLDAADKSGKGWRTDIRRREVRREPDSFEEGDIFQICISALRDAARSAAAPADDLRNRVASWLGHPRGIRRRIGLCALRERYADLAELAAVVVEDRSTYFDDVEVQAELEDLITDRWSDFEPGFRQSVEAFIREGCQYEHIKAFTPEEREGISQSWQLDWVLRLEKAEPEVGQDLAELRERLKTKLGRTKPMARPPGAVWTIGAERAPEVADPASVDAWLDLMRTYDHEKRTDREYEPTGIESNFVQQVSINPEPFAQRASEFLGLRYPAYFRGLIWGCHTALHQNELDLPVLPVLEAISAAFGGELKDELQGPRAARPPDEGFDKGTRAETLQAIALMLRDVIPVEHPRPLTRDEFRLAAELILRLAPAVRHRPFHKAVEGARYEWVTEIINSLEGLAFEALIFLGRRAQLATLREDDPCRDVQPARIMTDSLAQLDRGLDSENLVVAACYGWHFADLFLLDKAWVEKNLGRIFPEDPVRWGAVWDAYICVDRIFYEQFHMLSQQYERAIDALDTPRGGEPPDWAERLGGHLAVVYEAGELDPLDGLFERFLRVAPDSSRAQVAWWFSGQLERAASDPDRRSQSWAKALEYWRIRSEECRDADPSDVEKEFGALSRLVEHVPADADMAALEPLLITVCRLGGSAILEHLVLEFLAKIAQGNPGVAVRALRAMWDYGKVPYARLHWRYRDDSPVVQVLTNALGSDDGNVTSAAQDLTDELMKTEGFGYGKLLRDTQSSDA